MRDHFFSALRDTLTESMEPVQMSTKNYCIYQHYIILRLCFTATLLKNGMTDYELYDIE
jgi:hypothetical protein